MSSSSDTIPPRPVNNAQDRRRQVAEASRGRGRAFDRTIAPQEEAVSIDPSDEDTAGSDEENAPVLDFMSALACTLRDAAVKAKPGTSRKRAEEPASTSAVNPELPRRASPRAPKEQRVKQAHKDIQKAVLGYVPDAPEPAAASTERPRRLKRSAAQANALDVLMTAVRTNTLGRR